MNTHQTEYLQSVLDDLAALGSIVGLEQLQTRCARHADRTRFFDPDGSRQFVRFRLWMACADAADWRRRAVLARLSGHIADALRCERRSEWWVAQLARVMEQERARQTVALVHLIDGLHAQLDIAEQDCPHWDYTDGVIRDYPCCRRVFDLEDRIARLRSEIRSLK